MQPTYAALKEQDDNVEEILGLIQENVQYAPYIIFGMLLLAGLNIPVSEDAMLFISAILAAKNPDMMWLLFIGVYLGAYCSDLICFGLGWFLGDRIYQIKFFANMVSKEKIAKVSQFYESHGIKVLVFGRFIPFGVRNALFLTAGLGKMNPVRFALSDLFAATISCSLFFSLYYNYGEGVIEWVKKSNMVLFSIFIVVLIGYLIKNKRKKASQLELDS